MTSLKQIQQQIRGMANPADAVHLARFFKTGPGAYGAGDVFLGIRVPQARALARQALDLSLPDTGRLLQSRYHEERLLALLILVERYKKRTTSESDRDAIFDCYCAHTERINNWDLVDLSAPGIVGPHLQNRPRDPLYRWVESPVLWERRIAIIATMHFIKQMDFHDTFRLADALLRDPHDLIHKAVGWMLREIGKRDKSAEEEFLRPRYLEMPRTMLRYAIEKFPEPERLRWLRK